MPTHKPRWRLRSLLAVRLALVSVGVTLLLFAFYFTKYVMDKPNLRRLTLAAETNAIFTALRRDEDPERLAQYKQFPQAYGFRVYDGRGLDTRHLVAQANPELFTSFFPTRTGDQTKHAEIAAGVLVGPGDRPDLDRWMLTDHEDIGPNAYWVQVVMIGDPGGRWWGVMADEMVEHVVIPVLSVVPALGLAMILTTAIGLRPLERTARQAAALGEAVDTRARFMPLSTEKLPLEFYEVVTAINTMLLKIEHAFDLQKQFTSDAAHELRTPLAILLLELDQLPPGPTVNDIRESVKKLAALIEELLQFAQAENASKEERQPVDLVAIARAVCEDLASPAHKRRQIIEFEATDQAVTIFGHQPLIETAIRNVVDNALKYSPEGTTISVSVDPSSQVLISDAGPGIRDEHKELVFNRFWRGNRRHATGVGIGLAMVRRIAELHGGSVRVEDRTGGGTRVILSFAAAASPTLAKGEVAKTAP
jgi:signal transduction histidine kinase